MIIELMTYWKTITELGGTVNIPAITLTEEIASTRDVTNEESNTFYTGDNLVVLQCEVTPDQLTSLKASPDCFVMRVGKISRAPAKMKSWLTKRGINRVEMQDAKFDTDNDIKSIIAQHKERKKSR